MQAAHPSAAIAAAPSGEKPVALHFLWSNFGRIHKSLRVTPAMAAGIAKSPWTAEDVVAMLDQLTPKPGPRGPYRKRTNSDQLAS
jgi:hypothetical protein